MENLTVKWSVSQEQRSLPSRLSRTVGSRASSANPPKPKLLDQVRQALRLRHCSRTAEDAYVTWIKRFIFFHHVRHSIERSEPGHL